MSTTVSTKTHFQNVISVHQLFHRSRTFFKPQLNLLLTLIQTVLLSGCPTPFSTLQEYSPSSERETSSMTRVPLGRLRMPPPASSRTGCQVPRRPEVQRFVIGTERFDWGKSKPQRLATFYLTCNVVVRENFMQIDFGAHLFSNAKLGLTSNAIVIL